MTGGYLPGLDISLMNGIDKPDFINDHRWFKVFVFLIMNHSLVGTRVAFFKPFYKMYRNLALLN